MTPTSKRALGDRGELAARQLLESQGMRWVASNWRCEAGELDLVMLDGEELVVVEVKTRTGERSGRAEESISQAKSRKLLVSAEWFVDAHPEHRDRIWRVDLLALTLRADGSLLRVSHIENAILIG